MKLHKSYEAHETHPKKTSIGNNHSRTKFSSMNKHKKRISKTREKKPHVSIEISNVSYRSCF